MHTGTIRLAGEILGLAGVYFLAARLGLLLAIPPGFAAPIWPAAGIALAATLIFGLRVLPGVWLGSFLANLAIALDPGDTEGISWLLRSLPLTLSISAGATLQAAAGAMLIRRFVGFPTPLQRERDIIVFFGLGGPLSCVLSASIGVTALALTGAAPAADYAFNWWTWWAGDTIGVLVVTPLVLTWIGQPRAAWLRRRKSVALPLGLAFAAMVTVAIAARSQFPAGQPGLLTWPLLSAIIAFIGLLGAFLLIISGHAMLFEQLAAERSVELERKRQTEQTLLASEAQLRATFEQAAVGIAHMSLPGRRFLRVNNAFCQMTGYARDELLNSSAPAITHPDDRAAGERQYDELMAGRSASFMLDKRYLRKDGRPIWVRVAVSSVTDARGEPPYLISVIEDITHEKLAEQARQDTERRLELAVGIAQLGSWEWPLGADALHWSPLLKRQLGYQQHELAGRFDEWVARLHPDERERMLDYARNRAEYELEYRLRHRDGQYRWFLTRAARVAGAGDARVMLVAAHLDVTERKLAEQRIRDAAQHDSLTGLPNRALIFEYAGHLIAAAERSHGQGAFLFIDLDRFKPINDLYGHEIGDRLLQEVARRLLDCTRQEDLVGRVGGDEFVIVLPRTDRGPGAATVAQHILRSIGQPFPIGALELSLSPSIGISQYPRDGNDVDALVRAADVAMNHAKLSGRATYQHYSPELDRDTDETLSLEAKLKHALCHDRLALHYQPIIDIPSGRAIGAEALVRLIDEDPATAGPERFIPVAESAGLIGQLGAWVAAEACRQHKAWRSQGLPPIMIAINVSPLQFRQRGFAEQLTGIVADAGVEPRFLQIEVTESALVDSIDDAVETLLRIKALGMKVALDDFGTGYSSLSHLSTLPIDKLKIDQSFVRRLGRDAASQAITEAIIALGRTLKLEVVAEGIETESALRYLREHGCGQAQGFLFSRPVPADGFARWYLGQMDRESQIV